MFRVQITLYVENMYGNQLIFFFFKVPFISFLQMDSSYTVYIYIIYICYIMFLRFLYDGVATYD